MRVLVTGAAGFIGRHLVARLEADGHEVSGLDDFSTSDSKWTKERDASIWEQDVTDYANVEAWLGGGCDVLYHLACPASPVHYQKDPCKTLETAFVGTSNVLHAISEYGWAGAEGTRVVLASTSEVYGDPLVSPQPEGYLGNVSTLGPRSMYDEGKRAAEAAAWAYRTQHGVDVRIARIFNTYGPGMARADGRLVPTLVCQALAGEPMTVKGDGSQKRSLCYVSDTVDALVRIAGEGRRDYLPVYNVGNPDERTVTEIAEAIYAATIPAGMMGRCPLWGQTNRQGEVHRCENISFLAADKDDPRQRCPDISRIQRELGWAPVVPLAEGLRRTVEWFRGRV